MLISQYLCVNLHGILDYHKQNEEKEYHILCVGRAAGAGIL